MGRAQTDIAEIVQANDKLLKALITLLAMRDEHLLDELRTVFGLAALEGSELGHASAPAWRHIRRELAMIARLVDDDDEPTASPPPSFS
ncbi:hypothetical protein [Caulobacter mirabilis]|uniref:Uncharacterized protein n=1 Tax=Caulobacter mirabilis TaxID=69666 RepID=A0A2D2AYB8_9CAUL|nr:hypothetical protein [Caulobacter mirabilis]ATQ43006.1 hypothetical protein CSW64_11600 [Caulobacter mirabilis]